MKRSKSIDLNRMRKKRMLKLGSLSAMAGSVSLLSGCNDFEIKENISAKVYRSVDICKALNFGNEQLCEIAYKQAIKRSVTPRYALEKHCLIDFKSCHLESYVLGEMYTPDIAGFLLARVSRSASDDICFETNSFGYNGACYSSKIVYEGNDEYTQNYYTGDGDRISRRNEEDDSPLELEMDVDIFVPNYKRARTSARGGFGDKASSLGDESTYVSSYSAPYSRSRKSYSESYSRSSKSSSWGG